MSRPSARASPDQNDEKSPDLFRLGLGAQRERVLGGKGKGWRLRGDRTLLLDEAIEDRARRASREHVGDDGCGFGLLERRAVQLGDMSFRATKIGGADLHAGRAEGKRGSDPTRIGDAAGGDDRNRHGVDDLRHERKGPDLRVDTLVSMNMPRWPPASAPWAMTTSAPFS
jgi:hypothetical protein